MGGLVAATGASFGAKESGEKLAARVGEPTLHAELGDHLPIMAAALLAIGGRGSSWPDAKTKQGRSRR
jgi:hypothetical protein